MLKPRVLRRGDTVMAVSLSWGGPATIPHRYEAGKHQFEDEFGVRVVESRHALRDAAWLARNPRARADDLMEAFADPSVAAIVSTIGGDDSIRLLPFVNLDVIRSHPKIFLGFSDSTVTHMMCHRAGVTSFYGPSFMKGFAENTGILPYAADAVRKTLFSAAPPGRLEPSADGWTDEFLDWADPSNQRRRRRRQPPMPWRLLQGRGTARGPLIGGCLEVWQWLRGTALWPDDRCFDGAILFLETSEEGAPPKMIARELRVHAAMGLLPRLSAILFGRPGGRVDPARFGSYDQAILGVVRDELGLHDLPIVTRMDFGHTDPMLVLPYGVMAEVNCDTRSVSIVESGVRD